MPVYELTPEQKAAARGAEKLDEAKPGWADNFDLEGLDLGDPDRCIGPQVSGSHGSMLEELGLARHESAAHGFGTSNPIAYKQLTAAWKDEVRQRQEGIRVTSDVQSQELSLILH